MLATGYPRSPLAVSTRFLGTRGRELRADGINLGPERIRGSSTSPRGGGGHPQRGVEDAAARTLTPLSAAPRRPDALGLRTRTGSVSSELPGEPHLRRTPDRLRGGPGFLGCCSRSRLLVPLEHRRTPTCEGQGGRSSSILPKPCSTRFLSRETSGRLRAEPAAAGTIRSTPCAAGGSAGRGARPGSREGDMPRGESVASRTGRGCWNSAAVMLPRRSRPTGTLARTSSLRPTYPWGRSVRATALAEQAHSRFSGCCCANSECRHQEQKVTGSHQHRCNGSPDRVWARHDTRDRRESVGRAHRLIGGLLLGRRSHEGRSGAAPHGRALVLEQSDLVLLVTVVTTKANSTSATCHPCLRRSRRRRTGADPSSLRGSRGSARTRYNGVRQGVGAFPCWRRESRTPTF